MQQYNEVELRRLLRVLELNLNNLPRSEANLAQQIHQKYRQLLLKWHPNKQTSSEESKVRTQAILDAHQKLLHQKALRPELQKSLEAYRRQRQSAKTKTTPTQAYEAARAKREENVTRRRQAAREARMQQARDEARRRQQRDAAFQNFQRKEAQERQKKNAAFQNFLKERGRATAIVEKST